MPLEKTRTLVKPRVALLRRGDGGVGRGATMSRPGLVSRIAAGIPSNVTCMPLSSVGGSVVGERSMVDDERPEPVIEYRPPETTAFASPLKALAIPSSERLEEAGTLTRSTPAGPARRLGETPRYRDSCGPAATPGTPQLSR